MEKKKGSKLPKPAQPADSTSHLRAFVTPNASGSVLFSYLNRPTVPRMPAVRPSSAGVIVIDERATTDEKEIRRALSEQAPPTWSDRDAPATQRPKSGPPEIPSRVPEASAELTGTLTRIDGPNAGRVVALGPQQLTIGRSTRADLHLADEGVSRKHARICWTNGGYMLEDLESHNGTFVWGQPVTAVQLRQGDLIRIGPIATLRFCWMDEHQKTLIEELYESSVRDPLTGAFNRRHFAERLDAEIAYAKRHGAELSLLLLDIDYFKKINDQYGHLEGDRVLSELTRACLQALRTEDMFARYGGEEFAILLRGVPLSGAARAAERLRIAIAEQVFVGTPPFPVSVSIGCASIQCIDEAVAGALIHVADQRLYEAKQAGRGRVVAEGFFSRESAGPAST
ncbi:MAG TPA: GGDEF domain-containing protein [Polyangiaceae bacterium]|nr:GGDEF domain-containing protein [Polyangiaceae bacterium]